MRDTHRMDEVLRVDLECLLLTLMSTTHSSSGSGSSSRTESHQLCRTTSMVPFLKASAQMQANTVPLEETNTPHHAHTHTHDRSLDPAPQTSAVNGAPSSRALHAPCVRSRCSVGRPRCGLTGGDYGCQPHIRGALNGSAPQPPGAPYNSAFVRCLVAVSPSEKRKEDKGRYDGGGPA